MARRKTWREKLTEDHPSHNRIVPIPPKMQQRYGAGTMLIPSPRSVEAQVRKTRKGELLLVTELRERLAKDAGADVACPLTTGIFLRLVAEAAEEDRAAGKRRIAPYWRVLQAGGKLNPKFPGGVAAQAEKLVAEGHTLIPGKGKQPPAVAGFSSRTEDRPS